MLGPCGVGEGAGVSAGEAVDWAKDGVAAAPGDAAAGEGVAGTAVTGISEDALGIIVMRKQPESKTVAASRASAGRIPLPLRFINIPSLICA